MHPGPFFMDEFLNIDSNDRVLAGSLLACEVGERTRGHLYDVVIQQTFYLFACIVESSVFDGRTFCPMQHASS